jgi:uncharacterized protein
MRTETTTTDPTTHEEVIPLDTLHPRAVVLWRIAALARGTLLTAAVLAAEWILDLPVPVALPAVLTAGLVITHAIALPPLRYRAWGFAVRETDLYLRHGILFRTTSIVPHARIQHVDTRHGPIDRWLGLATLVVFTAGTRGAIVSIPALGMDVAESIRDHLAELSGVGDAV